MKGNSFASVQVTPALFHCSLKVGYHRVAMLAHIYWIVVDWVWVRTEFRRKIATRIRVCLCTALCCELFEANDNDEKTNKRKQKAKNGRNRELKWNFIDDSMFLLLSEISFHWTSPSLSWIMMHLHPHTANERHHHAIPLWMRWDTKIINGALVVRARTCNKIGAYSRTEKKI